VQSVGEKFGFILVNPLDTLFFGAHQVDLPMTIRDLRSGDAVEFRLSRNRQRLVACNVRKTLAFRTASNSRCCNAKTISGFSVSALFVPRYAFF
jgi:cold shock CspA family protein